MQNAGMCIIYFIIGWLAAFIQIKIMPKFRMLFTNTGKQNNYPSAKKINQSKQ